MSEKQFLLKSSLTAPYIAWPTVLLFFTSVALWSVSFILTIKDVISYEIGILLSSLASFIIFTAMHDSAHRSLSKLRWINEVIGRFSSFVLIVPFQSFRYIHMEHHHNTNDPIKDPDFWSGNGSRLMLPFHWLTQDFHYLFFYIKNSASRPKFEQKETFLTFLAFLAFVLVLCLTGFAKPILLLWVLPAKIAVFFLAYSLDYLPHKPHKIKASEDKYKSTSIFPNPLLTPILLYQNYHLIHHLYPGVPFYRYSQIWNLQKSDLIKKGAQVRSLFGQSS